MKTKTLPTRDEKIMKTRQIQNIVNEALSETSLKYMNRHLSEPKLGFRGLS
jgi:hypothetical protein